MKRRSENVKCNLTTHSRESFTADWTDVVINEFDSFMHSTVLCFFYFTVFVRLFRTCCGAVKSKLKMDGIGGCLNGRQNGIFDARNPGVTNFQLFPVVINLYVIAAVKFMKH